MARLLDVSDLVVQLHSNIDSIHSAIQSLSDISPHDAEISRLKTGHGAQILALRANHERLGEELAEQRKAEEAVLAVKRRKEEDELQETRKREDEELSARIQKQQQERNELLLKEDRKREEERLDIERQATEHAEREIDMLENEMERRLDEAKIRVKELDGKRKEINRKIDELLNTPAAFPEIQFRRRAKLRKSGAQSDSVMDNALSASEITPSCDIPAKNNISLFENIPAPRALVYGPEKTKENVASIPGERLNNGHPPKYPRPDTELGFSCEARRPISKRECVELPPTKDSPKNLSTQDILLSTFDKQDYQPQTPMSRISKHAAEPKAIKRAVADDLENIKARAEAARASKDPLATTRAQRQQNVPTTNAESIIGRKSDIKSIREPQALDHALIPVMPISYRGDTMLERLWSRETYVGERYFAGPLRPDTMIDRLWNGEGYGESQQWESSRKDPMLSRLWNNDRYPQYVFEAYTNDPLLNRLWNGATYTSEGYNKHRGDPMLSRLWNSESYIENAQQETGRDDPMLRRLWNYTKYEYEQYPSFKDDPMHCRLWSDKKYMNQVYLAEKSRGDPMLGRLWNGERYGEEGYQSIRDDPMLGRLWSGVKYDEGRYRPPQNDPILSRLWNGERYSENGYATGRIDPMLGRLWNGERYETVGDRSPRNDPMLERLWSGETYTTGVSAQKKDPMLERLWKAARYRPDVMLDRLWNGQYYTGESRPGSKLLRQDTSPQELSLQRDGQMINRLWGNHEYEHISLTSVPDVGGPFDSTHYEHPDTRYQTSSGDEDFGSFIPESATSTRSQLSYDTVLSTAHASGLDDDSQDEDRSPIEQPSRLFTSLASVIKSDTPLISQYLKSQEYASVPSTDEVQNSGHHHINHPETPFSARDDPTHTHTEIVQPFETHVHSSPGDSSPTTPPDAALGPFSKLHEPAIQDSWSGPQPGAFHACDAGYGSYVSRKPRGNMEGHFENAPRNPKKGGVRELSGAVEVVPRSLDAVPGPPSPAVSLADLRRSVGGECREGGVEERGEGRGGDGLRAGGDRRRSEFLDALSRFAGGLYKGLGEERGRLLGDE